jgi:hypothetical protein
LGLAPFSSSWARVGNSAAGVLSTGTVVAAADSVAWTVERLELRHAVELPLVVAHGHLVVESGGMSGGSGVPAQTMVRSPSAPQELPRTMVRSPSAETAERKRVQLQEPQTGQQTFCDLSI